MTEVLDLTPQAQAATVVEEEIPLVGLTPLAEEKIFEILNSKNIPNHRLRIFIAGGGCSGFQYGMAFDEAPEKEDKEFTVGRVGLLVDPASAMYLEGAEVDYVDSLMGGGFRIENPNAVSTCSCGQSFDAGGGHSEHHH